MRVPRIILGMALLIALAPRAMASGAPSEAQVKAAMILNFAQFVEWPREALGGSDAPLVIGVVDDPAVEEALAQLAAEKTIVGRAVKVKRYSLAAGPEPVHILFVSGNREGDFARYLPRLEAKPVLTIGAAGPFTSGGGIIGFYTEQGKLRFEINTAAADRTGLKISSKLLKLARIVRR